MKKIESYIATSTGANIVVNDMTRFIPKENIAEVFEKYGGSFTKTI